MLRPSQASRWVVLAAAGAVAAAALVGPASPASATTALPWMDTTLGADQRAALVLAEMSLHQKANLLIQTGGPGVPELGIPAIRGRDASNGVSLTPASTALPVGLALASAWNDELAGVYGSVAGEQVRGAGYNSAAAPSMDLARNPWNGRQWESYGEDPLLSGRLATAQTRGIQSKVPAEVKHYNVYTQETRRGHVDAVVDERTLQEVYIRPWEKVVSEADPASVMCSFNKINGEHGCSSGTMLNTILKGQLGFKGFVQTDYDAAHSIDDFSKGLDTSGEKLDYSGANLEQAVLSGRVPQQRVDDAARRVLVSMFKYGVIDNPPPGSFTTPMPATPALPAAMLERGDEVATEVGEQSIVLLKNDRSQLPLSTAATKSIAVIGSDADHYIDGGGSAAVTNPINAQQSGYGNGTGGNSTAAQLTTILDGITGRAGRGVAVRHAAGTDPVGTADTLPGPAPVPSGVLSGVRAEYHLGLNSFASPAMLTRAEKQVQLRLGLSNDTINSSQVPGVPFPLPVAPISVRWTGTLTAPSTGTYGLSLSSLGTAKLYVDGRLALDNPATTYGTRTVQLPLTAGKSVKVQVDYTTDAPNQFDGSLNDQPGAMVRLGWTPPADVLSPAMKEAAALAKKSDVAVVVARDYTGEGADRGSLTLPQDQDKLIRAVAAANPRTVVVLATSGAVTMPWLSKVPAVIEAWYGGQQQGKSVAKVLFGDVNPSGKLPVTFPASEAQPTRMGVQPAFDDIDEVNPTVTYAEGLNIGYRGYAKNDLEPLFPFGYGLSYTRFDYSSLSTRGIDTRHKGKGHADDVARVKLRVRNTGERAGTEIVQVYVGKLPGKAASPVKQLAGYARVTLQPGKKSTVTIDLDERALQYWDAGADRWVTPAGDVPVFVGTSSADARLTGTITVE
ncbi:beta-glucosidase [Motilibacter aurantiacus]|uniref:beta-glucosidase n=1 Tax=Motilibacter aurantiacus TaxID=2714955 RepID=UPI001408804E|nr:glycoside hydrolase family 3 C-terminal domain-containing protein [Motilibacter aurantiacus]NHC46655.1 beta-glucosidase [Motilibacter aurantiacus]